MLSQENLTDRPDDPSCLQNDYRLASCANAVVCNVCIHGYMISFPATLNVVFKDPVEQP